MPVLVSDFFQVLLFNSNYPDRVFTNRHGQEEGGALIDGFLLNTPLLEYYQQLDLKKYIFTNSNLAQGSQPIHDYLRPVFSEIWQPKDIGADKSETQTYQKIASKLTVKTQEILFIDDSPSNIQAALEAGCQASVYHNNAQIMKFIEKNYEK